SGDHAKVAAWRRRNAIERTCRWRPDLLESAGLTEEERVWAREFLDEIESKGGA
ncbi:MAG: tRNA (guanosine(37)-N1)-methyltransferase TrmD, partial [Collinsella sp.]|nr:tRNA (guanosine(37)-N1)-methyltransferase TrmD [Collinsella sp.]